MRIGDKNVRIGEENVRIETTGSWLKAKNVWIEYVKELQAKGKITGITSTAIIDVTLMELYQAYIQSLTTSSTSASASLCKTPTPPQATMKQNTQTRTS